MGEPSDDEAFSPGAFAVYRFPDGATLQLDLQRGDVFQDAFGELVEGHRVNVSVTGERLLKAMARSGDGQPVMSYHLDDELRLHRGARLCPMMVINEGPPAACDHIVVEYDLLGLPAPYGLSLPAERREGVAHYELGGPQRAVLEAADGEGWFRWTHGEGAPSPASPYRSLFQYDAGGVAPTAIRLVGLEKEDEPPYIGRLVEGTTDWGSWQRAAEAPAAEAEGSPSELGLPDGSDRTYLGSPATIREAFEHLVAESGEVAAALDEGGCLASVGVWPSGWGAIELPLPPPLGRTPIYETHFFGHEFTILGKDDHATRWSVVVSDDGLRNEWRIEKEQVEARDYGCDAFRRGPAPAVGLEAFQEQAEALPLSTNGSAWAIGMHRWSDGPVRDVALGPELLDITWNPAAHLEPWPFYHASAYASTGQWRMLVIHPDDLVAMDQGEARSPGT
ncbi:MAG: hypothetical protein ACPGQL_08545 [Thermoplasmatota archaeon]